MTATIVILIPVLERPSRVEPLLESITDSSEFIVQRPLFLVSPHDERELKAIEKAGADYIEMPFSHGPGDYARKINTGFQMSDEPFVFLGADDLEFHAGWAERALATWQETGVCVIGTNDLGNHRVTSGTHATHSLVHRGYGECGTIDEDAVLLHEGYVHNFVDDEFVQTAMWRGTYVQDLESRVEHLHPNWGKGGEDDVYRLGQAKFHQDRAYYAQRRKLWERIRPA